MVFYGDCTVLHFYCLQRSPFLQVFVNTSFLLMFCLALNANPSEYKLISLCVLIYTPLVNSDLEHLPRNLLDT